MPDVTKCKAAEVATVFREFHRLPRVEEGSGDLPIGQIDHQEPPPGTGLSSDSRIVFHVSNGQRAAAQVRRMPELIGKFYLDALRILVDVYPKPSLRKGPSDFSEGRVYKQTPEPGVDMRDVQEIILYISTGPLPIVPDVVGSYKNDALVRLKQERLGAKFLGEDPSRLERGKVTRTEPVAGTQVDQGSEVGYWLASGENRVPPLLDKPVPDAQEALESEGFQRGAITLQQDADHPERVIGSDPREGDIQPLGTEVALTVGTIQRVIVPDVVNLREDIAVNKLAENTLRTEFRGEGLSTLERGRVQRIDPKAGTQVPYNTVIGYWLALGRNTVPRLRGKSIKASPNILEKAGFRQGAITYRNDRGKAGVVLDSNPAEGAIAPVGSAVALIVSIDDKVAVPNVIGMSLDEAKSELQSKGFAMDTVREFRLARPDLVISQRPAANGVPVERGTVVSLTVSLSLALMLAMGGSAVAGTAGLAKVFLPPHIIPSLDPQVPLLDWPNVLMESAPAISLRAHLEVGEIDWELSIPVIREAGHD